MSNQPSETPNNGFGGAETIVNEQGWIERAPIPGSEAIKLALENSINLCGLNKQQIELILKGEFIDQETLNSRGVATKRIIIEYDVKENASSLEV